MLSKKEKMKHFFDFVFFRLFVFFKYRDVDIFLFGHKLHWWGGGGGTEGGSRYDRGGWKVSQVVVTLPQRRNGLVLVPVVPPPPTDPPAPITPPGPVGPPKISWGGGATPGPIRPEPGGAIGESPLYGMLMGLGCIMPRPIPGAPIPILIGTMPIPGCTMPSMGLGGTGLVRRPLRPSEEGWGEMEVIGGATPKGLDDAGVGETPLLEMVLPGVTAMPVAGDEPGTEETRTRDKSKFTRLTHF